MRRASSAWPRALLILCAPVCVRSSRFRKIRAPPASPCQPRRLVERRRPPDVVREQVVELGEERRRPRARESTRARAPRSARRASRARSGRRTGRSSRARRGRACPNTGRSTAGFSAHGSHLHARQRVEERARADRILDARRRSTPDDTSIQPVGRARTASATFSGVSPPARMTRGARAMPGRAVPVDDAAGAAVADGVVRVEQQRRAGPLRDLGLGVWRPSATALITRASRRAHEVRRLGSVQLHGTQDRPHSRCASIPRPAHRRTRRLAARTRGTSRPIDRAASSSTSRGLDGQKMNPTAVAPSATASSASSAA